MAIKIKYSKTFIKILNDLKIDIQDHISPLNRPCKFHLDRTSSFQAVVT